MQKKTTALITIAAIVVVGGFGTVGAVKVNEVLHQGTVHYAAAADAPTNGDLAKVLPTWIPSDAKDIDVVFDTKSVGWSVKYTASSGSPSACKPTGSAPDPATGASWIPSDRSDGIRLCPASGVHGPVYLKTDGDSYVGWVGKSKSD